MKVLFLFLCIAVNSFSQERLQPIAYTSKYVTTTKSGTSIDGNIYYKFDTLALPFFDDFSKNKFSVKNALPGDPNVVPFEYFRLSTQSDVTLSASTLLSSIPTKRKTYTGASFVEIDLPLINVLERDLSIYPVSSNLVSYYPPYTIIDTTDFANPSDTIWLSNPDVIQDSATIYIAKVQDPSKLWEDQYVHHNYTRAKLPWTLGVASFDGLNENGYPYAINTSTSGFADRLTSKKIDLSDVNPGDSLYLSFLYQSSGFGDEPESSDSLKLQFYNSISDSWQQVWSAVGTPFSDFKVGHIRITQNAYLQEGFQFRFINVGGLSGMLDEFHLDYVNLRVGSGKQDTLFKDYAFVYPVGSLIEKYTRVPWDHWLNEPTHMNSEVNITVRNNSNIAENNQNGQLLIVDDVSLESSYILNGQTLSGGNPNYDPRTSYTSIHDCSTPYSFENTSISETKSFDVIAVATAPFPNFTGNDSCRVQQIFEDEYAYDDGSAEAAYGIIGAQARFAMRFEPYEGDTLLGVNMHFVPTVNDLSDNLFLLTVWDEVDGKPGNILYEDDFFAPRSPIYGSSRDEFISYFIDDSSLILSDAPFYVGFRQIDADRLNMGFDRNVINNNEVKFSLNGGLTWITSTTPGTPMIRPMFSTTSNKDLYVSEQTKSAWQIFPNPSNGIFNFHSANSDEFNGSVLNYLGQIVFQFKNQKSIDLSAFNNGIYFIQLENENNVKKVILQK